MGQTLSEPITTKESSSIQNSKVKVGSSCMQGWRVSMEDAHSHILALGPEDNSASFFGVFDGHGGAKVAAHASRHLHRFIVRRPEYKKGDVEEAIREGFLECDRAMKEEESLKDEMAGSTSVTVLMKGDTLWCGNAGDSRCIAGINGKAEPLSVDHKPMDPKERARIESAGGFVEFNRVNGNLALSRALGDFVFKMNEGLPQSEQIVSAEPDVEVCEVNTDWDFLVLACDGIWDVLSNQEVADFVTKRLAVAMEPEDICEELMTRCLSPDCQMGGLGCDNMTVVLVCLLHGEPFSRLTEKCASLVKTKEEERRLELEEELRLAEAEAEEEVRRAQGLQEDLALANSEEEEKGQEEECSTSEDCVQSGS